MKLPLRERRRLQTELEIQRATLSLAQEQGFDNVTTEAIADRAGISPRTFFNYYPNKEAAAVGRPPGFPEHAREVFQAGQGPIRDDLRNLLVAHLEQLAERLDIVQRVGDLWRENGKVKWMLDTEIEKLSAELGDCLAVRLPDMPPRLRKSLADWTMRCSGLAIGLWASGEAQTLPEALDKIWAEQLALAQFLVT